MGLFTSKQRSDMQDLLFKEEFHSLFVGLQTYIPVKCYHLLPFPSQLCFYSYFSPCAFMKKVEKKSKEKKRDRKHEIWETSGRESGFLVAHSQTFS